MLGFVEGWAERGNVFDECLSGVWKINLDQVVGGVVQINFDLPTANEGSRRCPPQEATLRHGTLSRSFNQSEPESSPVSDCLSHPVQLTSLLFLLFFSFTCSLRGRMEFNMRTPDVAKSQFPYTKFIYIEPGCSYSC